MEQVTNEEVVRRFATAILLQAATDKCELKKRGYVQDDSGGKDETVNKEELNEFCASEWCSELCKMAGIDDRSTTKKFLFDQYLEGK